MEADYIIGLTYADRLRRVSEARFQALAAYLGAGPQRLTGLMGPMSDGPAWPSAAAWLAARRKDRLWLFSDGLSDPWVERDLPETGLGLEIYIESSDELLTEQQPPEALADTWMFPALAEISHTLAGYPRLCEKLLAGELLSLEFNIEHIKDGRGRVGALLGLPSGVAELNIAAGNVRLIPATLLTPAELRFLRGKGAAGRAALAEKLWSNGIGHLSLLRRLDLTEDL